jgi:type IV secretory pathway VirB4 component
MRDLVVGSCDNSLVYIPKNLRERHFYIVGKTGVGKTSLIQRLILQDAKKNYAVVILDSGNLAKVIYETMPDEFMPRVRFFSINTPFAYNPLLRARDIGTVETELCSLLDQVVVESSRTIPLTARMKRLLSIALHDIFTLNHSPTLSDLVMYLRKSVYPLRDRMGMNDLKREFLVAYEGIVDRLNQILRHGKMRRIVCQPHKLDFNKVLDNGYILIISLAQLDPPIARMVGATLFQGLQSTIFERSEDDSKECAIYVDEFQDYIRSQYSAEMFRKIFQQGRRHRVSFTIAHQDFSYVDSNLLDAIHGNPATLAAFSCGDKEASKMSRIFGEPDNWKGILKNDDHIARIRIGNEVQTIETYPPPKAKRRLPKVTYDKTDPPDPFDISPQYPQGDDVNMEVHEPGPTYKDATLERLRKNRAIRRDGGSDNQQSSDTPKTKTRSRKRV